MAGLVPAIHVRMRGGKTWMPGTSPGMTEQEVTFSEDLCYVDATGVPSAGRLASSACKVDSVE
ncbi:hypothetical protein ABIA45_003638 [Bradyrhizobium sp. USDA 336]